MGDMTSINHTSNMAESGEWWEVDLGREVLIDEVRIYNRNDSPTTESRLKNYILEILDSKGNPQGENYPRTTELVDCFQKFLTQAFRGQAVDQSFIDRLLKYYHNKRKVDGLKHREALASTLAIRLELPNVSLQVRVLFAGPTNNQPARTRPATLLFSMECPSRRHPHQAGNRRQTIRLQSSPPTNQPTP